mgnify:CR=1 FL=1
MITFLIIVAIVSSIASVIGLVLGANVRIMFFPGILIGSSHDIHDYSFKNDDEKVEQMKINQLQFCLIFIAITIIWEAK